MEREEGEPQAVNISGPARLAMRMLAGAGSGDRILFVAPQESGLPIHLRRHLASPRILHIDYALYRADKALLENGVSADLHLGITQTHIPAEDASLAVVFMPKGKRFAEFILATVAEALPSGTPVILTGTKRNGIKSATPLLARLVGQVYDSAFAYHATALTARVAIEATAARRMVLAGAMQSYTVSAWDGTIQVVTLPGVFSDGRLDDGTAFLLDHLQTPQVSGRALDWGCGAGVIGSLLQRANPQARVDLVDVSTMSLDAARLTLRANGHPDGYVWLSDVFSDISTTYDLIISNPPFHRLQEVDYSMSWEFIQGAATHLSHQGRLVIVTNRFINYFGPLREWFGEVEIIAQDQRYRVIDARNPRHQTTTVSSLKCNSFG